MNLLFGKDTDDTNIFYESLEENLAFSNLSINITDSKGNIKNVLASITPIKRDENVLSVVFVFRDTKGNALRWQKKFNKKLLN